jgi:hypothetical protein
VTNGGAAKGHAVENYDGDNDIIKIDDESLGLLNRWHADCVLNDRGTEVFLF